MNLGELIQIKIDYNKLMEVKLLEMVCFFQDNLYDGYSDEDDPKFISKEDFDAMEALADKINHMIFNIGCPNSVEPMIQSIISRKLKYWQASDSIETDDKKYYLPSKDPSDKFIRTKKIVKKGHGKGRQLKSKDEKRIVHESKDWMWQTKGEIIKGHFRWNDRGYIISRRATDLLEEFYFNNFNS